MLNFAVLVTHQTSADTADVDMCADRARHVLCLCNRCVSNARNAHRDVHAYVVGPHVVAAEKILDRPA